MMKLIVENVSKFYGEFQALDCVSLTVDPGELLVIMGPSGCGKTSLLLVILGVLKMSGGHIYLGDKLINSINVEERNIGYVPQDFGLFPHLTVYDNVAFGLKVRGKNPHEIDGKVEDLLVSVELEELNGRKPSELSGGQRQRVALARALAIQPSLLLLDEPLSNIDEFTKIDVRKNLKEAIKKTGITTLCVMHDIEDSFELGDRIAIMYSGKIIQHGKPYDLLKNPINELVSKIIKNYSPKIELMKNYQNNHQNNNAVF